MYLSVGHSIFPSIFSPWILKETQINSLPWITGLWCIMAGDLCNIVCDEGECGKILNISAMICSKIFLFRTSLVQAAVILLGR